MHDVPRQEQEYVEDLMGQPSVKFDYKALYPKHPPPVVPLADIEPTWGPEFDIYDKNTPWPKNWGERLKDWEKADAWQEFLDKENRSVGIEQDIRTLCDEIDKKIPFPRDEIDSYVVQVKKDGKIRDCFKFDAWYSSDEDELEIDNVMQIVDAEPALVTRSGRDFQRKDLGKQKEADKEPEKIVVEETASTDIVTEQLKKTKTNASIWDLLISSESHRRALVKALTQIPIPETATPDEVVRLMTERKKGEITFSDEDLPLEGRDHNKALFIAAEVNGKRTSCVMVDDGSSINVCPSKLLAKMGIAKEDLKPSDLVIRAYDDSKRAVEGTFTAKVKTGPIVSEVEFTVLDIPMRFVVLLGRPWFHALGGVPSTVHQKIKFPY